MEQRFLTRDNLDFIREAFPALGILSIDVDGNDYWFLEALIGIQPAIICVEYNASFGLEPVTSLVRRASLEDVFLRLTGRSLIE